MYSKTISCSCLFRWPLKCVQVTHEKAQLEVSCIAKKSLTSPIVINVPTRVSLAAETKGLLCMCLVNLNKKNNVCKQISSLLKTRNAAEYTCTLK